MISLFKPTQDDLHRPTFAGLDCHQAQQKDGIVLLMVNQIHL